MYYVYGQDVRGEWRWSLLASNHYVIAVSS